jgi:hypothetical protein
LLSFADFQSLTGMVNHKRKDMQKSGWSFQRCIQHIVIMGWLASLGTQAVAQKGVIVIQGEIIAPTCVTDNFNVLPGRSSKNDDKHACVGYIEPLSANAIPTKPRVTDKALANQSIDERIRTLIYR